MRMGQRSSVRWVTLLAALLLVLSQLVISSSSDPVSGDSGGSTQPDGDDDWEDFEEDDEVSLAAASSKAHGQAVKALPQLNDENSEKVFNSTEFVFVLAYAPWCKHSAAAMIDFAGAATILTAEGNPALLAKLDATASTDTAKKYNIKGYPTVLLLTNGSAEIYRSGPTKEDFVTWVRKKTGLLAATFETTEEAQALKKKDGTVVIGLFDSFQGPDYEGFLSASKDVFDVDFLQTTSAEASKVFNPNLGDKVPAIAIWKAEPEKFVQYGGEFNGAAIAAFVSLNKFALVTKLHSRNSGKVYASPVKKQVILFANSYDYDSLYPLYLAAARHFKGELHFVWVDIEDEDFAKPMTTMYGIVDSAATVAGFDHSNGTKYLLESEVTKQSLKIFLIQYKEGRLKPHYKSEPIPKKNKGDVKVVVGKTFDRLVLKGSNDVLLMVYTPDCLNCVTLGKVLVKLAKHFKNISSTVFAKLDATLNDHPNLTATGYPDFQYYRASSNESNPVSFSGKAGFKTLAKFVEENDADLITETTKNTVPEEAESEHIGNLPLANAEEVASVLEDNKVETQFPAQSPEVVTSESSVDTNSRSPTEQVEQLEILDTKTDPILSGAIHSKVTDTDGLGSDLTEEFTGSERPLVPVSELSAPVSGVDREEQSKFPDESVKHPSVHEIEGGTKTSEETSPGHDEL